MLDRSHARTWMLLAAMLGAGCTEPPSPTYDEGTSSSGPTEGTTTLASGSTAALDESSGGVDGSSPDVGRDDDGGWPCSDEQDEWHAISCEPGPAVAFECDVVEQDCAAEDKCMPWALDGGRTWNGTRCSLVDREPDAPGDPCTVEGSAVSGFDSCELGSMCWKVDPVTLEGVCVPMCSGDVLLCEDSEERCVTVNDGAIALCLPECDPLGRGCASDEACVPDPSERHWFCAPTLDHPALDGEACEFINPCVSGSACVSTWVGLQGCEGVSGCCTSLCELGGKSSCPMGTDCVAWYLPGMAPAGLETLGLCSAHPDVPDGGWTGHHLDHLLADFGR